MENTNYHLPDPADVYNLIAHIRENQLDMSEDGTMDITIASNGVCPDSWAFQTGDNSYSGGCYHYSHWAVGTIDKDTNEVDLGDDLLSQLDELLYQSL